MVFLNKKKNTKKKSKNSFNRISRFEPLFDSAYSKKFKDKFLNTMFDAVYGQKKKAVLGKGDAFEISESYKLDSEYVISQVLEAIPTADPRFDIKMAVDKFGERGVPRGKAIEISGPEENMKSTLAHHIIKAAQSDPRGAIVKIYETEGKANPRYIEAAGCDISQIVILFPDYIEQVYWDIRNTLKAYIKDRNKSVLEFVKKYAKKSMTNMEFDELIFRGRMSYPLLLFLYDSIGNHQSMEAYKKNEAGKITKTPGKHAQAHAEGYRDIITPLCNAMGILMAVNHTKDEMGGMVGAWGVKRTTTFGGKHIKYMSSIRIEQRAGSAGGEGMSSSMMTVVRDGVKVPIGKWLTTKILKNSLIESSHSAIEHRLFRYKSGVGFDLGVSFTIALAELGMVKGKPSFTPSASNKIKLPGRTIDIGFREFHDMLVKDDKLRLELRKMIIEHANNNATMLRYDC